LRGVPRSCTSCSTKSQLLWPCNHSLAKTQIVQLVYTPLWSNNNKTNCDSCFCSAHNNFIFVVMSMLLVGREPTRGTSRPNTVRHATPTSRLRPVFAPLFPCLSRRPSSAFQFSNSNAMAQLSAIKHRNTTVSGQVTLFATTTV
jgi:hypothetical protein